MAESQDRSGGLSDTGRAEAFSDGILAVIITLLVFELAPPDHEPGKLLEGLWRQWPLYLATATSFLYVAVVWTNHKAAFRRIRGIDRGLHWVNLGVLFATALLPFPTATVADVVDAGNATDARVAVAFYALVGVVVCLAWLVFYDYLGRHPHLVEDDVDDAFFPRERIRAIVGCAAYLLAGVLGVVVAPWIPLVVFAVLPVFYAITSEGLYELPITIGGR